MGYGIGGSGMTQANLPVYSDDSFGGGSFEQQGDPYGAWREKARFAGDSYALADQMLQAGGRGGRGGYNENSFLFTDAARNLNRIGGSEHPGMSDTELRGVLGGIDSQARRRRGELGGAMSQFGGSVDPGMYARASRSLEGDRMSAYGGAYGNQIALDRQALIGATQALSPYMTESARAIGKAADERGRLAGDIFGSAQWGMRRTG